MIHDQPFVEVADDVRKRRVPDVEDRATHAERARGSRQQPAAQAERAAVEQREPVRVRQPSRRAIGVEVAADAIEPDLLAAVAEGLADVPGRRGKDDAIALRQAGHDVMTATRNVGPAVDRE